MVCLNNLNRVVESWSWLCLLDCVEVFGFLCRFVTGGRFFWP